MRMQDTVIKGMILALVLGGSVAHAQSINNWRGDASGGQWNDPYKWKLSHTPTEGEAAHFRGENSVISVNNTVELNNGMHLYGQELLLQGNGNINLRSPVPHQRTVNIPASATGFANMTLTDNLSLNGRVALSAKGFGTSASKGSLTLKDRSNVTGDLCIGNAGTGTGQVYVKGNSTFRITKLELSTEANKGGSAEIYIQGGTVRIETKEDPFNVFLADPSRKLIIADGGTLRIEYVMPVSRKKQVLIDLIKNDRIVAASGSRLTLPTIHDKMMIVQAEDARNATSYPDKKALIAGINQISSSSVANIASSGRSQPQKLESLLKSMKSGEEIVADTVPATSATVETTSDSNGKIAGYIAFMGAVLLVLRRPTAEIEQEEPAE